MYNSNSFTCPQSHGKHALKTNAKVCNKFKIKQLAHPEIIVGSSEYVWEAHPFFNGKFLPKGVYRTPGEGGQALLVTDKSLIDKVIENIDRRLILRPCVLFLKVPEVYVHDLNKLIARVNPPGRGFHISVMETQEMEPEPSSYIGPSRAMSKV